MAANSSEKTTNSARSSLQSTRTEQDNANNKKKTNGGCCKCLRSNLLLILTLAAVLSGLGTGYLLKDVYFTPVNLRFIALPGEILMSMFKGIVVPLIVVSIVAGIANMNAGNMGRLNGLAFLYYFTTTLVAVVIGLGLVMLIHPGNPEQKIQADSSRKIPENVQLHTVLYDLIINLFPDNIFSAAFQSRKTLTQIIPRPKSINGTNGTDLTTNDTMNLSVELVHLMNLTRVVLDKARNASSFDTDFASLNQTLRLLIEKEEGSINRLEEKVKEIENGPSKDGDMKYSLVSREGSNILGLLVYSFIFGLLISYSKEKGQHLKDVFTSLDYLIGRFVNLIIWYSPIGIFSLLLTQMLINGDFGAMVKSLGLYIITVLSGLFIHLFLVLFPIYIIFTRKNPFKLVKGVAEMMAVAFGTSSSVAALPLHFKCLQEKMGVSKEICQMVLPVACTVNMNGTALYEAVASIFIAQLNGISLSFVDCIIVSLMSTIAALGAAAIPSAGLFTMVMILSALNVPIEDISLIMSIDWLLDRIRTTINCLGDSVGASIIDVYAKRRGLVQDSTMITTTNNEETNVETDNE